ncbi:cell division protein FtsQ [Pseudomonas sp. S12(2018)]|uniref:alginate O-acetyltransferase AlgX-related protein n=1 Tax=Pseudomonas sp. S12(2018) TaxID=2219664 RepID=UPI0020CC5807|nr:hypothetical protein [Pseudomonas sp. S12(2018)]MCQ0169683.1 cell division protein FtsQ [Pseudomonas sp. S12(2018)]
MATVQKPPSHRLSAAAIIALLVVGQAVGVDMLLHAKLEPSQLKPSAWADGSAGQVLGQALKLPLQEDADTLTAAVRYRFFGNLGAQVVQGCPGWLYYRDGLRAQPGVTGAYEARLRLMRHWVGELRAQGLQVLVVAVPDKSRIQTEGLCGLQQSAQLQARLQHWQASLAGNGVAYADLYPALAKGDEPRFFHTDVHMTASGAQAAAEAVGARALSLLGHKGAQTFSSTEPGAAVARMGDLISLAGLEKAPPAWRPPLDIEHPVHITPIRSGGLLDDTPPVEVLLAGSSNGRRSEFAERLGIQLGRQVWNQSMDGGQFCGALLATLKKRDTWPTSLKLVIWEFSEMALSLPLTADERAVLATLPEQQDDHAL